MSYIFRPVKMELDLLASLEEAADINQIRQETIDPNNFEVDQTSEIEEHLAVASLEPLYLGVLLCLGSWYLVGFSTPIQSVLALKKHPRTFMKIHPLHWCTAQYTLQIINLQARRTSVVPQDHKETLRNEPKNFQKALEQLKKSWHTSGSWWSNDKRPCEANIKGEKEEINRGKTVTYSLGETKHKR